MREVLQNRFRAIRHRCESPKHIGYSKYGGRGIKCEWNSFEEFFADMSESFSEHVRINGIKATQIDRIDTNGNYSTRNCRWVTPTINCNNTRRNRNITFKGKTMPVGSWERELGIPSRMLYQRIFRLGWSIEKAMTLSKKKNQFA